MNHPKMTSAGRRWAFLIGIFVAFLLPKRVPCTHEGESCGRPGRWKHEVCRPYEIEPWGFSLLERVFDADVGFAYTSGEDCD